MALCLFAVAVIVLNLTARTLFEGSLPPGASYKSRIEGPYQIRVVSALTTSPLRPGDRIDLAALSPVSRYRLSTRALAGERFDMPVERAGPHLTVTLTAEPYWQEFRARPFRAQVAFFVGFAGDFWIVFFAAIIGWRRSDSPQGRILCALLATFILRVELAPNNWATPWLPLDLVCHGIAGSVGALTLALLTTYAASFGQPVSRLRAVLTWGAYATSALTAMLEIVTLVVTLQPAGSIGELMRRHGSPPYEAVTIVLPFVCALLAIRSTHGRERSAITWTTASLAPFYIVIFTSRLLGSSTPLWLTDVANVMLFVAPLGLTYSLFARRLLDIGFALNRATIIGGVSLLVFAAFSLIEWALGGWLSTLNRSTNLAVSALLALALALGLSLRPIHGRVERVVDLVLFRKRYEDERALRGFAHEAAYFTDADALVLETQRAIERHADISRVTLALDDGAGRIGATPENDPAIVALRAWRKPVDLHAIESELHGEFAYPMIARGRLVSALVVGPKHNDESLAPDESEAIARIAHSVGNALDLLASKEDRNRDELLAAIQSLGAGIQELAVGIAGVSMRLDSLGAEPRATRNA
jgi:hypothetical protein